MRGKAALAKRDDLRIILADRRKWSRLSTRRMKLYGWSSAASACFAGPGQGYVDLNSAAARDWILDLVTKAARDVDWADRVVRGFGRKSLWRDVKSKG